MSLTVDNINKDIIKWSIKRAGYNLVDYLSLNSHINDWINGNKKPTLKQLEKFANSVYLPFGYLFFDSPPQENIHFPFFRTGNGGHTNEVSLNVYDTIQIIQNRQDWLTDYLTDNGFPDLEFIGRFTINDNHKNISNDIKKTLGLNENWTKDFKTWEDTLKELVTKIEEIGVIVTFNGVVENNTRRKIPVNECRGFILVNKKAPFLFINNNDAKSAQMFTLIHELAHVWLNESAGFNNDKLLPAKNDLEILCDKVAAEFLTPENLFKKEWDKLNGDKKKLSKHFKVSPLVVARRALDLKLITRSDFFSFYNDNYNQSSKTSGAGGNFYTTARKRISSKFMSYVNSAVKENSLLYRDAYKLTSLKGNTYEKFVNEYLY